MNASTVQRSRHGTRRALGALVGVLVMLSATTPGARADLLPQAITFTSTAPAGAVVGGPTYTVTADGGLSGNAVTFSIDPSASAVCSISASTVSFIGAGLCTINADQAGDATYDAAPQVQQSFSVAAAPSLIAQTIAFTSSSPGGATVGGPTYTPTASATSGLPVAFTIDLSAAAICSISDATVSFIGAGLCVINADQAGDATYNAAPQVQQSFTVAAAPGDQEITFGPLADKTLADSPVTIEATASSGLAVTFSSTTAAVCTVAGTVVTLIAVGSCTIDADQAGDASWNPAPQVSQSFAVGAVVLPPPPGLPALTVTADAKSRPFGQANPPLTATISGFVNGQTLATSGVTGSPACATSATLASPAGTYPITCTIGTLASAAYTFVFAPGILTVARGTSSVTLSSSTTVFETSTPATFTAAVEPSSTGAIPSGSLLFTIDGVARPAVLLDAAGRGSVTATWTTPGVKSVEVSYAGDGSVADPGMASAAPSVVSNTARATGVGVLGSTFYPIVDRWRDTVTARGTRSEPLALAIEVRNASGVVVRRYAAGPAAGAYAWTWNGKTTRGALTAAGKYTIVQTLIDPYGSRPRRTVSSTVTVSLRKVRWTTTTITVSRGPRCFQFSSGDGVGSYSCSSTALLRLAGTAGHWPGVGYEFRLPTAGAYRSIRFEVRGAAAGARPTIGFQDWALGTPWGQLYRSGWTRSTVSPTATLWAGVTKVDLGHVVSGRTLRVYVDGGGRLGGAFAFDIAGGRLVVSVGTFE